MNTTRDRYFLRIYFFVFLLLAVAVIIEISQTLNKLGVLFSLRTFWWPVVLIGSLFVVGGVIFIWTSYFFVILNNINVFVRRWWPSHRIISVGAMIILSIGFSAFVMWGKQITLQGLYARFFLFFLTASLGAIALRPLVTDNKFKLSLVSSFLLTALIYRIMAFIPEVSNSPFSMGWSEGSRYYYGALFFSEKVFGNFVPLFPFRPSRYLMLSIPFIFSTESIWLHRLWQVLLWIGLTGGSAHFFAKRFKLHGFLPLLTLSSWVFLFLLQGPVYYHLLVCVMIIFFGVKKGKPFQSLISILVASAWAGLSRINWIPVPVFLAVSLYVLETPLSKFNNFWEYFLRIAGWSSGLFVAYFIFPIYVKLVGVSVKELSLSSPSNLLWYRLWPNSTFAPGILLASIISSIPIWLVIYFRVRNDGKRWHLSRIIVIVGMLALLFAGGLVVSVKIGGGSNLHNLDAYYVLLMVIGGYLFFGIDAPETETSAIMKPKQIPEIVWAIIVVIPIIFALQVGGTVTNRDRIAEESDLLVLNRLIEDSNTQSGEVLFITERQLQVFDFVQDIPLVSDYEKLELAEMANAENESYLDIFYDDISRQRFSLIVIDRFQLTRKTTAEPFHEEHNRWVEHVLLPLLEQYQYSPLSNHKRVFILTPKTY